jgi:mannose-6-phosphate isomerase-like protein (cupin superfamily)
LTLLLQVGICLGLMLVSIGTAAQAPTEPPSSTRTSALIAGGLGQGFPVLWDADWSMPDSVPNLQVTPVYTGEDASVFAIGVRRLVPAHIHKTHTETIVVLEGEGWMQIGPDSVHLQPGHLVVVPPGTVHGVRTTSKSPLRVWSIQAPEFMGQDRYWVRP